MSRDKGVEGLLHATARAVRECPSLRVEIAGDGPCLPDLRRVTEALRLTSQVRFLGQVRDVAGLLARSSLFVLPSLSEGISLTLLEAMARGLPVVATRAGGNSEVVADGSTGLLVPARDATALSAAMLRLHRDEQMARAMGQAGRRRAAECFDVRRMVAAYESLYRGQESGELSTAPWTPSLAAVS
jgi:glycosyltransferase involved in cell wall biosynthesis